MIGDVQTATCVASVGSGDVKYVVLSREDFVRMLGDLEIVLWAAANIKVAAVDAKF